MRRQRSLVVASVFKDLTGKFDANIIIKKVAPMIKGKGGGRSDFAQAGGEAHRRPGGIAGTRSAAPCGKTMKRNAIVFCCAWLIGAGLYAALIVRQDKNGHIVLSNTLDRVAGGKNGITFLPLPTPTPSPLQYKEKIQSLTEKHDLREDLVLAVAKAESSFNPFAVSPKGAVGHHAADEGHGPAIRGDQPLQRP